LKLFKNLDIIEMFPDEVESLEFVLDGAYYWPYFYLYATFLWDIFNNIRFIKM